LASFSCASFSEAASYPSFALTGELFEPKTFSGIFGAAPSVALATLSLAFASQGRSYVALEAGSMILGAVGLFAYSSATVALTKRRAVPMWLNASSALLAWLTVVGALWGAHMAAGILR
jgi:hypothetical protein